MKNFERGDQVREISSHNFLQLESIINDIKVAYYQCKLSYDYQADNGHSDPVGEIMCIGIDGIEQEITNIDIWFDCVQRGVNINS